jgi:hypothetical protein
MDSWSIFWRGKGSSLSLQVLGAPLKKGSISRPKILDQDENVWLLATKHSSLLFWRFKEKKFYFICPWRQVGHFSPWHQKVPLKY